MFVIRPITFHDLDVLETFAYGSAIGMSSLPRDRNLLQKKIACSLKSFQKDAASPVDEVYLFVLEDTETEKVGGSCGLYAKSGVREAGYFFRIETLDHPFLLHPTILRNGPTELCSLYLAPEWRKKNLGKFLSFSRFLFIANHRHRFDSTLMASLLGVIDHFSPFWEGLGHRLIPFSLQEAISIRQSNGDFSHMLPKYPIYIPLLSEQVQKVLGKPHKNSRPAFAMLTKEGFRRSEWVDLLDGGPVMIAQTEEICSIKESRLASIQEVTNKSLNTSQHLIMSNTRLENFRACKEKLNIIEEGKAIIGVDTAKALQVQKGDHIRYFS